jgi:hypothetical protein
VVALFLSAGEGKRMAVVTEGVGLDRLTLDHMRVERTSNVQWDVPLRWRLNTFQKESYMAVCTKERWVGKRTPYFEAVARLDCFHEAGHVVVGHALGWQLIRARAGRGINQVNFEPVTVRQPYCAETEEEMLGRTAKLRRAMAILAAGHVAATIHQQEVEKRGFASPQEKRAYSTYWEIRASIQFACGFEAGSTSDYYKLREGARDICLAQDLANGIPVFGVYLPEQNRFLPPTPPKDLKERALAEIEAAEEKAESILKQYWPAVRDVAGALHRGKSGQLTRFRLLALLEPHFGPQAMTA